MPSRIKKINLLKILATFLILIILASSSILLTRFTDIHVKEVRAAEGDAAWASTTVSAANHSKFYAAHTDSSGNIYTVGYITYNTTADFGNSVTVAGAYSGGQNLVIVKYNSSGVAQWAKTTTTASSDSVFYDVYTDSLDNVYAIGTIKSTNQYDFGDGITATGGYISSNIVIVKYNSDGTTQWATTPSTAPAASTLSGIVIDSSDNIYVVGTISGTSQYDFGGSVTATGAANATNVAILKYNTSGTAQWASTTVTASNNSYFTDLSLDSSGNIYVAGYAWSQNQYDFGNSVTITGPYTYENALIIKYNSSGVAQWATTLTTGPDRSYYHDIVTDSSGNSYVVGSMRGGAFDFGNSVTATGVNSSSNIILVKYNSSGVAQFASTVATGPGQSVFRGISTDSQGSLYATGEFYGNSEFDFGNGTTVTGAYTASNAMLVKYNTSGNAQWIRYPTTASNQSSYDNMIINSDDSIVVAGYIQGTSQFGFGNSVTTTASGGSVSTVHAALVKYQGYTPSTSSSTSQSTSSGPETIQIPSDDSGNSSTQAVSPIKDSNTGEQRVVVVVPAKTFVFNTFVSSIAQSPRSIYETISSAVSNISSHAVIAGDSFLGIKNKTGGISWQVGNLQKIFYKAYAPSGTTYDPAIIIPTLQQNSSIISLSYSDNDLIPPGDPTHPFPEKLLKLAKSEDGITWTIMSSSVVDTVNNTVAAVDKVGGYYMIVGKY